MYIRGMDRTLNEVQRLLSDQLSGAATVRVTPPEQGETTCKAVVQTYIERAQAYNGTCTQLVTRDERLRRFDPERILW